MLKRAAPDEIGIGHVTKSKFPKKENSTSRIETEAVPKSKPKPGQSCDEVVEVKEEFIENDETNIEIIQTYSPDNIKVNLSSLV